MALPIPRLKGKEVQQVLKIIRNSRTKWLLIILTLGGVCGGTLTWFSIMHKGVMQGLTATPPLAYLDWTAGTSGFTISQDGGVNHIATITGPVLPAHGSFEGVLSWIEDHQDRTSYTVTFKLGNVSLPFPLTRANFTTFEIKVSEPGGAVLIPWTSIRQTGSSATGVLTRGGAGSEHCVLWVKYSMTNQGFSSGLPWSADILAEVA